jgi:hypothetical protein
VKSSIITSMVGLLAVIAAVFDGAAALVSLPQWLDKERLLAVAIGAVACSVLLCVYLVLKVMAVAVGKLPGAGSLPAFPNMPRAAAITPHTADPGVSYPAANPQGRTPTAPGSGPARPSARDVARACNFVLLSEVVEAPPAVCVRCRGDVAGYRCTSHGAVLCAQCLPAHIAEVA